MPLAKFLRTIKLQNITAFIISLILVLSLSHHWFKFWELPLGRQLLTLALGIPALTFIIDLLLSFIWGDISKISWKRWLIFLVPAFLISTFLTWCVYKVPVVWHDLEIVPVGTFAPSQIQLLEIKDSGGAVVRFSRLKDLNGWTLRDDVLTNDSSTPGSIQYSFLGPINQPVTFTFLTSPLPGTVEIVVDGRSSEFDLSRPTGGLTTFQMNAQYRFGIHGAFLFWFILLMDVLTFVLLFSFLWTIQETEQTSQTLVKQNEEDSFLSHRKALLILLAISFVLHAFNYFSSSLILADDSPSHIQGAAYWMERHNLDRVDPSRGPGMTFLFIPVLVLFGRNPWGMKLLLHLLAIALVPLTYRLAWQLEGKRRFAFLAGLIVALTPDLFFYSNFVMSEIPNLAFVLLFSIFLLSALETLSLRWILTALLTGSFAVLVRSENLLILFIGGLFLLIKIIVKWLSDSSKKKEALIHILHLGLGTLLAILPVLAWMAHNERLHGFFGLSNYGGEVFYTGWVYQAEASHISFADSDSSAVQIIKDAYVPTAGSKPVPTGWDIYPFLIEKGYSEEQAFDILQQAALDSIKKDYRVTFDVFKVKMKAGFVPSMGLTETLRLPGEGSTINPIKAQYFDDEKPGFPSLILLQRKIYELTEVFYGPYQYWVWFCLLAIFLCFYRKPFILWMPIVLIGLTRVFFPILIGLSHWRPVISGIIIMEICALVLLQSLFAFLTRISANVRIKSWGR